MIKLSQTNRFKFWQDKINKKLRGKKETANEKPYCLKCSGLPVKEYKVDLCEKHYNEQWARGQDAYEDIYLGEEKFCVKCGKTSDLIEGEDMCYTDAEERGRI